MIFCSTPMVSKVCLVILVLEALALLKDFLKMIEKANLLTKNVVLHRTTSRHT